MDIQTVEVLQTWFPTLQKQEELQKMLLVYAIFGEVKIDRVEKYAAIIKEISNLHDHGDADIEIQIRNGVITNEMYGKRIRKC